MCCLYTLSFVLSRWEFLPWEIQVAFWKESQLQQSRYPTLLNYNFHNPPNYDMDYRSFNVHMWSFWCVRIHMGVGHTDSKSAQHFWLEKIITHFSCASDAVQTSGLWISSLTLYPLSHPVTPADPTSPYVMGYWVHHTGFPQTFCDKIPGLFKDFSRTKYVFSRTLMCYKLKYFCS